MIALQKLWKMFFNPSKKLFSISRYSDFCISVFPSFPPVSPCFRGWSNINLKVYNVINCPNKNLITHFVWYLEKEKRYDIETLSTDRVLNKEHFYGKVMQNLASFNRQSYQKQKGPGTSDQSLFRLQNEFTKIPLLVILSDQVWWKNIKWFFELFQKLHL